MKQKITFLFLMSSLIMITYCVEPDNFADNYTYGSYIRYKSGTVTGRDINITNIASYTFSAEIDEYKGTTPSKLEAFLNIGRKEYFVKSLNWGDPKISITGLEMAKAVNPSATSAEDFSKHISLGRSYSFIFYPYDSEGNKIKDDPNGLRPDAYRTYRNLNSVSNFAVSCPVTDSLIQGTYKVLSESLGDLNLKTADSLINVVYSGSDSIITIQNYPRPKFTYAGNPNTKVHNTKVKLNNFDIGAGLIQGIDSFGKYTLSGAIYSMGEKDSRGIVKRMPAKVFTCDNIIYLSITFDPGGSGFALNLKKQQ